MIYTYYNKELKKGVASTGLAGLARESGIPYHKLSYCFRNGTDTLETDSYLIIRSELIKGNQRVAKKSSAVKTPPDKEEDFMNELLK